MGIPDGQGARHITGNGGEKSKKRKKNPEMRKRRAKKKEKKVKRGLRRSNEGEKRKREREREIEVRKRREFGNPIGFCCASDSPIIETAFYTWKQLHGGTTVDSVQYRPYSVLYCYDVVLAFTQARMPASILLAIPYSCIILRMPECLRCVLSHIDILLVMAFQQGITTGCLSKVQYEQLLPEMRWHCSASPIFSIEYHRLEYTCSQTHTQRD